MNSRTDGSPITSGVAVVVPGDGGPQSAGGGPLTPKGNGHWNYTPTQAETNFNHVMYQFVHADGVNQSLNFYTCSVDSHDTTRLGLSALPNAAAGANGGLPTVNADNAVRVQSGTGIGQLDLSSGRVRLQDGTIARATFAADSGLQTIRSGTAQAGAANSITLDAGASSTNDFFVGAWILLTGGTGAGQARLITAYNGSTKVASVAPNWATNPDNTSTFAILPAAHVAGVHGNVTGSVASVTNRVTANVDQVDGQTLGAHGTGMFPADVRQFGGANGIFSGGRPEVNTTHFGGAALSQSGGRPEVNVTHVAGTAQTARDLGDMLDAKVS
ncbi:MAG: hypothetical protein NZ518_07235, partial [Dehalococcoidia bacterium]|nr:hypothetical protein [Dehalococcoidia bacterium]